MSFFCRAFGLLLQTDLPVPGAIPVAPSERGMEELSVRYGAVALTGVQGSSGPYRAGMEGIVFEKAGIARFLCGWDGRTVVVEPQPAVSPEEIAVYLIATALPAALWLRGGMMLHAAAAVLPGGSGAVALAGASGAGKSTLLKALLDAGAEVVAEDSLCLRKRNSDFEGSGLPGCIHLRVTGEGSHGERRALEVPPGRCRDDAPLQAVVVLEPCSEAAMAGGWSRLAAPEAMAAVLAHQHRPRVPAFAGLSAGLLPRWRDIACGVPVYSWKFFGQALGAGGEKHLLSALAALRRNMEERP